MDDPKKLCIYHRTDMDGFCAGALVKYCVPECDLLGMDYHDDLDMSQLEGVGTIFVVDFCLPLEQMEMLNRKYELIWCDHHVTSIKQGWALSFQPSGIQDVDHSGCALTWLYFQKIGKIGVQAVMPESIKLLESYDLGKVNERVLEYQYGLRSQVSGPLSDGWVPVILGYNYPKEQTIDIGKTILQFERNKIKKGMQNSFTTNFGGYKAVVLDWPDTFGLIYKDEMSKLDCELFATFSMVPGGKWRIIVTSHDKDIHAGKFCQKYGGGGHQAIGGMVCDELPFSVLNL